MMVLVLCVVPALVTSNLSKTLISVQYWHLCRLVAAGALLRKREIGSAARGASKITCGAFSAIIKTKTDVDK